MIDFGMKSRVKCVSMEADSRGLLDGWGLIINTMRGNLTFARSASEAFALPIIRERTTQNPRKI